MSKDISEKLELELKDVKPIMKSTDFIDIFELQKEFVSLYVNDLIKQRHKILEAFIAETGLLPSEIIQVAQQNLDGTISWYLKKK